MSGKRVRILTVLGARPQFIKAASLSSRIARKDNIEEHLLHTGQHYDGFMSDIFFEQLDIPKPKYELNIGSFTQCAQMAKMIEGIGGVLQANHYNLVLVYGDTNSTLAGAIAAVKSNIALAHVEAGLRSFDKAMPEEINRVISDRIADLHFCPNEQSKQQLRKEGIGAEHLVVSGDIMLESLRIFEPYAHKCTDFISAHSLAQDPYVLVTFHRSENTDNQERLKKISEEICSVARSTRVIFPMHPRTEKALRQCNKLSDISSTCEVITPVGFIEMICLIKHASAIVTDSGGLQKEACFLEKSVVLLRDRTEWTELLSSGRLKLFFGENELSLPELIAMTSAESIPAPIKYLGEAMPSEIILDKIEEYFT